MKKRLLALIMAGLLTASMASCVATGNQDTTGGGENKNPIITEDPNKNDKPTEVWKDVDKTLYTFKKAELRAEAKATGQLLLTLEAETELHCTKQNAQWSYVECNGQSGYVSNASITDIDLLAKSFKAVEGGAKTMYATAKLNVRLYPASEKELSVSKVMATLDWNDEVTVVSSNGEWSRIKIEVNGAEKFYFVSTEYLDSEKQIDPNDKSQWEHLFEDCDPTYIRYTAGNVYLRKAPSSKEGVEIIMTLDPSTKVTVLATGQMTAESNWSYVRVEIAPKKEGDGVTYEEGFLNSRYLLDKPSTAPVTLDDVLALYPGFEKLTTEKTMYATQGVYFRSNPTSFKAAYTANKVGTLAAKEAVTVVASGVYEDYTCLVFKYKVDDKVGFYFILADYLTTNADGIPMVTLDTLTIKYPNFEILSAPQSATVTTSKANCYLTPANAKKPQLVLEQGTSVKIVAKESGASAAWYVIQVASGELYFVNKSCID